MKSIKFKPTKLIDPVKAKGKIELGNIYTGELSSSGNVVWYTDFNDTEWCFFPGKTCEIIE